METQREADETRIRERIERLTEAIRAMDLERIAPIYAQDIVSFDIEPPLRHLGSEAKMGNWTRAFAAYRPPLGYEVRDLTITVGDGLAFGHTLAKISGTLGNGNRSEYWVRWTMCLRKTDDDWHIVHDQISVPLDFATGRAHLDLEP